MTNKGLELVKMISIYTMLIATALLFTKCDKEDDKASGAELIKEYKLAGKWKIQISPHLGAKQLTTGEHEAMIDDEGDGILRLHYKGFRAKPMPFEMSVDVKMKVTEGSDGTLTLEKIDGGTFDADRPAGAGPIDPSKLPDGVQFPKEALKKGVHSKNAVVSGTYNTTSNTFDLTLEPNVPMPVQVKIRSIKKID